MNPKKAASALGYFIYTVMYSLKGINATGMRTGKFIFSTDTESQMEALFDITSVSVLACGSLCLSNDECESYAFDSAISKCVGFSERCQRNVMSLGSTTKLYRRQKEIIYGQDVCGEDWLDIFGSCYFISNFTTDWYTASRYCQCMNSHLAIITSKDENDNVAAVCRQENVLTESEGFWLDGTDEQEEGTWIWNSTGDAVTYTNWNPGEPSAYWRQEHCLEMAKLFALAWNDIWCDKTTRQFVCEKKINDK